MNNIFKTLSTINVNDSIKSREGLKYLPWATAWAEVVKLYPDATYKVYKYENNLPYVHSPLGYMVFTSVTILNHTLEMHLVVTDTKNKTLKDEPYSYKVKSNGNEYEKKVAAINMFDINKTIMRCLTKNLAMFGLGLYLYQGEDLPEGEDDDNEIKKNQSNLDPITFVASNQNLANLAREHKLSRSKIIDIVKECEYDINKILDKFKQ